jgi:phosphatidylglycerol:prolipoprotein diacylglycerol transferase
MWPILATFSLGDATISVPAYGTFLLLAAAVALALGVRGAIGAGVSGRAALAGYSLAVAAGLVGSRLLDVALNWGPYAEAPGRIVALEPRGFALYGGFAAGLLVTGALARRWQVRFGSLADSAVPAVAAGIVLLRVGCFLNGCCAGTATDLPWGVAFPSAGPGLDTQILAGTGLLLVSDATVPVHPTQLYELVAALGCAAIALRLRRRGAAPGVPALAFAAVFLVFRAGSQVLRVPPPAATLPDLLPLAYLVAGLGTAALLGWRWQAIGALRVTAAATAGGAEVPST